MARILFINSDKSQCKKISKMFAKLNYEVDTAADISVVLKNKYQMDSFDLAIVQSEIIKNLNNTISGIKKNSPNLPVIAVTKLAIGNIDGVVKTSNNYSDILFKVEQILQEKEASSGCVVTETEKLTEQQRYELRKKRQFALISKRLEDFISKKI